jgi:hypothetical protein
MARIACFAPALHLLCTFFTLPLHLLCTCFTPVLYFLYTCFAPSLHLLYTFCTPALHLCYTCFTPALHLFYTCFTPSRYGLRNVRLYAADGTAARVPCPRPAAAGAAIFDPVLTVLTTFWPPVDCPVPPGRCNHRSRWKFGRDQNLTVVRICLWSNLTVNLDCGQI